MASTPCIEFRPVKINEGHQFVSLLNKTYARKKTPEYFIWQFFTSPLKSVLMGAFIKDRLVGCFGLQYRRLSDGLIGGQAIDLIVDEEFRGQGIFSQLGQEIDNHSKGSLDFYFSLPNPSGRRALCESLGYQDVITIKTLVLSGEGRDNSYYTGKAVEKQERPGIQSNEKAGNYLYFKREQEELNWRFKKNPDYTYSEIMGGEDAYAIVKIFTDPVSQEQFGDIVDFGFKVNSEKVLEDLFLNVTDYFRTKSIEKITCWPFHEIIVNVMKRIGFRETGQERYFCIKALSAGSDFLYDASKWFLVEADAEIY